MRRGRLDRFDACSDCFYWKVKQFLSRRKENLRRFKEAEIKYKDQDFNLMEIIKDPMGWAAEIWYEYEESLRPEDDYYE